MKFVTAQIVTATGHPSSLSVDADDGLVDVLITVKTEVGPKHNRFLDTLKQTQVTLPAFMAHAMVAMSKPSFDPVVQQFYEPFGTYSAAIADFGATMSMNLYMILEPLGAFHGLRNVHVNPYLVMQDQGATLNWFVRTSAVIPQQVVWDIENLMACVVTPALIHYDLATVYSVTPPRKDSDSAKGAGVYEYIVSQPITGPKNAQNSRILTEILAFPVRF